MSNNHSRHALPRLRATVPTLNTAFCRCCCHIWHTTTTASKDDCHKLDHTKSNGHQMEVQTSIHLSIHSYIYLFIHLLESAEHLRMNNIQTIRFERISYVHTYVCMYVWIKRRRLNNNAYYVYLEQTYRHTLNHADIKHSIAHTLYVGMSVCRSVCMFWWMC